MRKGEIKLTILVDNNADDGLSTEHGFLLWIETASQRILFDTGQGPALPGNACALEYDLSQADILVLSHGHYDHTGGVPHVLNVNPGIPVYCHAGTFVPRYSIRTEGGAKDISMPQQSRAALVGLPSRQIHWVAEPQLIQSDIGISGPIPRSHVFEDTGGPFFLDPKSQRPDLLDDDQALWIQTDRGLVIIVGCCHSGLLNTVDHIRRVSGIDKIRGIVGGLHLQHAPAQRLEKTYRAILDWDVEFLVPSHCTGKDVVSSMLGTFGDKVQRGRGGLTLVI
ncbi:MAG: hypothetical protein BA870_11130 [Desulfuromonadales bacterium C00003094]|nr:MAG: hypothetical protein BA870_11130 [Desulfuromonadales bacterium C00003094]